MIKIINFSLGLMVLFFVGCSTNIKSIKKSLDSGTEKYSYVDKNGNFILNRTAGFTKENERFFIKRQLEIIGRNKDNIIEQSITLSRAGLVKNKVPVLRPEESEFSIWFEGKKYTSKLALNKNKKAFDLRTTGPDRVDNVSRQIRFPSSKVISCFFSQLAECLNFNGFSRQAIKKESGSMRFYIIWDGYPFFNEAYSALPNELFSLATVSYDGELKKGEFRFNVNVGNQTILFVIDKDGQFLRMFWIAEGVTILRFDLRDGEDGE